MKGKSTTRDKILDAAEQLFADCGYARASIRAITARARVNLSVAYHYFESKESLLTEVLKRFILPVTEEEKKRLAAALEENSGEPLSLRKLLEIFSLPRLAHSSRRALAIVSMLFSQTRKNADGGRLVQIARGIFKETDEIFEREFSRTIPDLKLPELRLRIMCMNVILYSVLKKSHGEAKINRDITGISEEQFVEIIFNCFEAIMTAKPTI
ncbi:MAG: TetR/AcrR family transcriptional regulator [Opitutae bacterium]|nr:TetR/AcrR family transcriptional regulator [Opitutae bacterium]